MKRLLGAARLGLFVALAQFAWGAFAGQTCEEKPLSVEDTRRAFGLALKVREALDASGAEAVILGRVGQDLSSYGLRYSHAGIIWRDHPAGPWLAVHLLNECGGNQSTLYNQGLANFFGDDLFAWDALILIPSPAVQKRLAETLTGKAPHRMHQPLYNMVAYPFSTQYQNSNQWVLEVLANALAGERMATRAEAQKWLKQAKYQPSTLRIPTLTRLGGRMFKANVAFDDHPFDRRMAGQIDTITVDSISQFLAQRDTGTTSQVVSY
jgi:hypothetical protein